jgi:hypothetical protein
MKPPESKNAKKPVSFIHTLGKKTSGVPPHLHSEQIPYKRVVKFIFGHFSSSFGQNCVF